MLPASWRPLPVGDLARLGGPNDGGYIVSTGAVEAAELLVSLGLGDDWRFEADYRRRTGGKVLCFDHTVTRHYWVHYSYNALTYLHPVRACRYFAYRRFFDGKRAEHRPLRIGYDIPGGTSLNTIMREAAAARIFLKIDIEGAEYRILDQIPAHAERLTGLVVEFHDVDLHRERIAAFLAAMPDFRIVQLHGNNWGGTDAAGDPLIIEMSLAHADFLRDGPGAGTAPLPAPNDPARPDLELRYAAASH